MANFRINPDEKTKRINISLPPSVIDKLDEMTVLGHRSEWIRGCIEAAYPKRKLIEDAWKAQKEQK